MLRGGVSGKLLTRETHTVYPFDVVQTNIAQLIFFVLVCVMLGHHRNMENQVEAQAYTRLLPVHRKWGFPPHRSRNFLSDNACL
jgi:hypothetical protein